MKQNTVQILKSITVCLLGVLLIGMTFTFDQVNDVQKQWALLYFMTITGIAIAVISKSMLKEG
jgi:hypothetical protein